MRYALLVGDDGDSKTAGLEPGDGGRGAGQKLEAIGCEDPRVPDVTVDHLQPKKSGKWFVVLLS